MMYRTCIPTLVQRFDRLLSLSLPFVASVNVTDEMIPYIVTNMQFQEVTVFG